MAGWKISILESICMIVVVGMAVDYTVHLMHSYNETSSPKRFEKAQIALTEMGVSVVSGAFTTVVAATPLLFAQFIFFQRFGSFIAMITAASILWAVVYLMTLAMTVGPELKPGTNNLVGDVHFVKYTMRCKKDDGGGATREQEMVVNRKFSVDVEAPVPVTAMALQTSVSPLNKNKDSEVSKGEQKRVV
jgi:multidrug efflux pump subunit AcrB